MDRFVNCSILNAEYLGYDFQVPVYPWEALELHWGNIAIGISKVMIYNKFSSNCVKDHHFWSEGKFRLPMGVEALRFADLMSRDRGVRFAVKEFNSQSPKLKYGAWLEAFDRDTPNWIHQLTQFGQLMYNSVSFLIKTGYIMLYKADLGVEVLRPYWSPMSERSLKVTWFMRTFEFVLKFAKERKRRPSLKNIADFWKVPRYALIESEITRDILYEMYLYWKEHGTVKLLKPKKEFKLLTEKEQGKVAIKIAKRVSQ